MSASDPHDDEAALDRLLARARWEEPSAADEYRLREDWAHLRRRRRITPVIYLAAAASIGIVVALSMMQTTQPQDAGVAVKMLVIRPAEDPPLMESRQATAYEMLQVMRAPVSTHAAAVMAAPAKPESKLDPSVRKLVDQLGDPLVKNRYTAAEKLACTDPPVVVPILREMVEQGVNRREALTALLLCTDPSAARALAEVRASRTIDAQLTAVRAELQGTNLLRRFSWSIAS